MGTGCPCARTGADSRRSMGGNAIPREGYEKGVFRALLGGCEEDPQAFVCLAAAPTLKRTFRRRTTAPHVLRSRHHQWGA